MASHPIAHKCFAAISAASHLRFGELRVGLLNPISERVDIGTGGLEDAHGGAHRRQNLSVATAREQAQRARQRVAYRKREIDHDATSHNGKKWWGRESRSLCGHSRS